MGKKEKLVGNGSVKTVPPLNGVDTMKLHDFSDEKIVMSEADAQKVRDMQNIIVQAKLQLADLHLQASDINSKLSETANLIRVRSSEMMDIIKQVAVSCGIDPDGEKDTKRWNLNTNDMIFYRVK